MTSRKNILNFQIEGSKIEEITLLRALFDENDYKKTVQI